MIGGGSGANRGSSGRPRHSTPGTSQSSSDPTSSTAARGHRNSVSDTRLENDEATASTGRRSAFLEPLPLSRSSSVTIGSSPTSPSSANGELSVDTSDNDNDGNSRKANKQVMRICVEFKFILIFCEYKIM